MPSKHTKPRRNPPRRLSPPAPRKFENSRHATIDYAQLAHDIDLGRDQIHALLQFVGNRLRQNGVKLIDTSAFRHLIRKACDNFRAQVDTVCEMRSLLETINFDRGDRAVYRRLQNHLKDVRRFETLEAQVLRYLLDPSPVECDFKSLLLRRDWQNSCDELVGNCSNGKVGLRMQKQFYYCRTLAASMLVRALFVLNAEKTASADEWPRKVALDQGLLVINQSGLFKARKLPGGLIAPSFTFAL